MIFSGDVPREQLTINEIAADILASCIEFHHRVEPSKTIEELENFYGDYINFGIASGDKAFGYIQDQISSGKGDEVNIQRAFLYITQSYAIEAIQSNARGEEKLAERLLLDACYWLGNMRNSFGSEKTLQKTIKNSRSRFAKMGGHGRAEIDQPIREEIYRYVRDNGPWESRSKAAAEISRYSMKEECSLVLVRERVLNGRYREAIPYNTVYDWLRKMSDAEGIFKK